MSIDSAVSQLATLSSVGGPAGVLGPTLQPSPGCMAWLEQLRQTFDSGFHLYPADSEDPAIRQPDLPVGGAFLRPLIARVAGGEAGLMVRGPVGWLAIPVPVHDATAWVAVAPFAVHPRDGDGHVEQPDDATAAWLEGQLPWPAQGLGQLATTLLKQVQAEKTSTRLQCEVEQVSDSLGATYEEISLLYGITQNLRISRSDVELGTLALEWVRDCLPLESVALQYLPVAESCDSTCKARTEPVLLQDSESPISEREFDELIQYLNIARDGNPVIVNSSRTSADNWPFPAIRQLVAVPLLEGDNVYGWLVAMNTCDGSDLGTEEASLLGSIGVLLGIHCGNHELYRQQAELLSAVVRALTSAIDAKDPYTCGHSDRVAQMSVRLARELGYDSEYQNTIYMAGLLHDIGKIGIDDQVLRKPGRLTDAEYEHIKLHPELGARILEDLKQLSDVMPAVMHHHEQWNGSGYPHGLAGKQIPAMARIMAVADSYDAMTSDRPYRLGMVDEDVDGVFRDGAGSQWDAEVVAAFFRAREDLRSISARDRVEGPREQWS